MKQICIHYICISSERFCSRNMLHMHGQGHSALHENCTELQTILLMYTVYLEFTFITISSHISFQVSICQHLFRQIQLIHGTFQPS